MNALVLLPAPRTIQFSTDSLVLGANKRIVVQGAAPADLLFSARRLQALLHAYASVEWEIGASMAGPAEQIGAVLRVAPERIAHPQGYTIAIGADGILIEAHAPAGIFYAVNTLAQLLEQCGATLPQLQCSDWPDFAARGVMLDISRDKVPTMDTLYTIIEMLAAWKINQIQLYIEHTFAYRAHPEVWAAASPLTGQNMLDLDQFCRERFIDLVPNQNSFGHMHRWLQHPRYAPLAEVAKGFMTPWGYREGTFSLAPRNPDSLELMRGLYDELLPHFSSGMFNVGCDETFDLGQGQSKEDCEEEGVGRVYLDYLKQIHAEVSARGRVMQFWGDIIVQHAELIPELPKDAIALEWGYEAGHPFETLCPQYAAAGMPFYVCPGTSSWCSLAGRTDNALGNLQGAATHGLQNGAIGYLNTDWGDRGHWQTLPISYLGFAAGAAYAWALDANRALDLPAALDRYAFRDRAGVMGRLAYDLGNIYRALGLEPHNGSALFWILQLPLDQHGNYATIAPESFAQAQAAIDRALEPLAQAQMQRADAELIREEFALTGQMLRHACKRGLLAKLPAGAEADALRAELAEDIQALIATYRRVWLARNQPGGLADSAARFEQLLAEYRAA